MTIDAYLDELCAALTVDPLRRDEIRLETHLHLRERTHDLIKERLDPMAAEDRAVQEFGEVGEVAARMSHAQPPEASAGLARPIRSVGVLMIGIGCYWLCLILVTTNLDYMQREPLSQKIYDLVLLTLVLPLPIASGIGLLRLQRWARWGAVLTSAYALYMLIGLYRTFLHNGFYSGYDWHNFRAMLPIVPVGSLSFYVLWTLLQPRYRALSWR